LDGNDHPDLDPKGADKGTAYSGHRVNARSRNRRQIQWQNHRHAAIRAFSGS